MRQANLQWMSDIQDTGFVPETALNKRTVGIAAYDYMRSDPGRVTQWIKVAEAATSNKTSIDELKSFLQSDDAVVRYWGATGLLILGDGARPAMMELKKAAADSSINVAVVAAEALYKLGEPNAGRKAILIALRSPDPMARNLALNVIDEVAENSLEIKEAVITMVKSAGDLDRSQYDLRSARQLFSKWKLDLKRYDIVMDW